MTSTLTQEPTQIVAGDSVEWLRSLPGYLATEGWTLHYILLSQGKTPITLDSVASGSDHLISLTAIITKDWSAADYRWSSYVTKDAQRCTLSSGLLRIQPDPTTQTSAFDPRTDNQKILEAITAMLAGELTNPLVEYKIEGREAKRHSRMELLKLQGIYKQRVAVESGQSSFFGTIPIGFVSDNGIAGGSYGPL